MNNVIDRKTRHIQMKKTFENFENQFFKNTKAVNDMIRKKDKTTMHETLVKIENEGLNYIQDILEEDDKASKLPKKKTTYSTIDLLEQEFKLNKTPEDNFADLIHSNKKNCEMNEKDEYGIHIEGRTARIKELTGNLSKNVNMHINEIDNLKDKINSITDSMKKNESIYDAFVYAIKNNKLETVVNMIKEKPELVNHVFPVNIYFNY